RSAILLARPPSTAPSTTWSARIWVARASSARRRATSPPSSVRAPRRGAGSWCLLLHFGRIVFEDLVHRVRDALVALLGFRGRVDFLRPHAAPHHVLLAGVGDVDDERADQNVSPLGGRRAAAPAAAPAIPVRPVAAAVPGAEGRNVLLFVERHVIDDDHIGVRWRLREALGGHRRIDGGDDP